ncbi:MAG: hypothetical protein LBC74_07795 [Planctomycetaceae bacterium]|jgi:hypothetical protein|nr:hypothetical protein [Planctomycetaceae bacterium]
MKKIFITLLLLPFCCAIFIFSGCNQEVPSDLPKTYPATITVIQDGQKLSGASVRLEPSDGGKWYASAITDASGVAILRANSQYSGVVTGKYKILISKRDATSNNITVPDPNTDPAGYSKALEEMNNAKEEFDLVDPKYGEANTTPEEIEITTGKNEKNIDVGKAVKITIKK